MGLKSGSAAKEFRFRLMSKAVTSVLRREAKETEELSWQKTEKAMPSALPFLFVALTGPKRPEAVSGIARASRGDLHLDHCLCLWAFGALRHFEFNFLALFEGLEAVSLNGAIVNEDV